MLVLAQATLPSLGIPPGKLAFATVNATLNGAATLLLLVALIHIRSGRWRAHAYTMVAALLTSAVFLICYLTSKVVFGEVTTAQMSNGAVPPWAKALYLVVLIPHLIAAVGMLPMIALTVNHAAHRRWPEHRRLARPTWAIWFYVSISGVLVYWMLYHWIPTFRPA